MAKSAEPSAAGAVATQQSHSKSLGRLKVTALSDGYFDLPPAYFLGLCEDAARRLGPGPVRIDVNAFLVESPGRTLLIDTGCGDKLGPTVNRLSTSLRSAGVEPAAIDAILCTHIHPDHTNGLVDAAGAAVFPNAEVMVHEDELTFWLSDDHMARATDEMKLQFAWARAAFAPYRDRVRTFRSGEVVGGIHAEPLFGHTPGHCGYLLDGGDRQMLIWGDCVHAIDLQTEHPEVTFAADVDPAAARQIRRRLFDRVATDQVIVTGMHVTFPGFGQIIRAGDRYRFAADA